MPKKGSGAGTKKAVGATKRSKAPRKSAAGVTKRNGNSITVRTQSRKMAQLINGDITVQDLDDEELINFRFKDKGGKFRGRPPAIIPHELAVAAQQELLDRGRAMFEANYLEAILTMAQLMRNAEEPAIQQKAAQYIIERIGGKTPDKSEVAVDAKWQIVLDRIVVPGGGNGQPVVIPGEVESREDTG